jgi:hypothetical protein
MRLSPGWFNHRNSEVWWNCLRSAVSIIDTSGERHSHSSCSADHSPYTSQLLPLRRFGRRTNRSVVPSRRSHQQTSFSRSSQKDIKREKFHHREVLANHRQGHSNGRERRSVEERRVHADSLTGNKTGTRTIRGYGVSDWGYLRWTITPKLCCLETRESNKAN